MLNNTRAYLKTKHVKAVLSVPVKFNSNQVSATLNAAKLGGLQCVNLQHEPSAAAVAYGTDVYDFDSLIIVYDFGGGTLDVSLMTVESNMFKVIGESGDNFLGGQDFNRNIMHWVLEDNPSISKNKDHLQELRDSIERAKIQLSTKNESIISVHATGFQRSITREQFESINGQLFERAMKPIYYLLKKYNVSRHQVRKVVFVGGTTRIPKLSTMMHEFFGRNPYKEINPDHAIVLGNAILGQSMSDTGGVNAAVI